MNILKTTNIFNRNNMKITTACIRFSTKGKGSTDNSKSTKKNETRQPIVPPEYRFIYPEFLPDPKIEWRNPLREKLERMDMLARRANIDIPEFYVGTVMAVTWVDLTSSGKTNRFVGICINRDRCGLRARFILRNVVDHQGVEYQFEMYDPKISKIEVLRLEKRLDDHLLYLRDALPEYSTFDMNMEPETLPEGSPVPINDTKVKLKPRPWLERWERQNLKGISNLKDFLKEKHILSAKRVETPWEKFDLMKQYRRTIPEEEQKEIYAEVYSQLHQQELSRKITKRKRTLVKPKNIE